MDKSESKRPQQAIEQNGGNATRTDVCVGAIGAHRDQYDNTALQNRSRLADRIAVYPTQFQERVYDLRNCGPRHQFTVWDVQAGKARIVSNCVQAISRDILCHAMMRMASAGLSIVTHVHDEVVMEASPGVSTEAVCALMCDAPPWAKGLLLRAEGFEAEFYKKD